MASDRFHNPYTFVPAPVRGDAVQRSELGDGPPRGHDRYDATAWTGTLSVELELVTPLLLPDPARASVVGASHRFLPPRVRAGEPAIAPTAVKGMLRTAYEMVTNSRFGVFTSGRERLAFRQEAAAALRLTPVLVRGRRVEFLAPARLLMYPKRRVGRTWVPAVGERGLRYLDEPDLEPRHGHRAVANLRVSGKDVRVEEIARRGLRVREGLVQAPGIVWISNDNIENKQYERFFFDVSRLAGDRGQVPGELRKRWDETRRWSGAELSAEVIEDWNDVLLSYRREAEREVSRRRAARRPLEDRFEEDGRSRDALSKHVVEDLSRWRLETDSDRTVFAFARVTKVDGRPRVSALFPVHVSRQLHPLTPEACLDPSLRPASRWDGLSPAERVFGWVREGSGEAGTSAAHRGQLRVGPVRPARDVRERRFEGGLPLAILSSPKPQQARFYLGVADPVQGSRPQPPGQKSEVGYSRDHSERTLRGRKAYVHHAGLPAGYWAGPEAALRAGDRWREYLRAGGKRDDQNFSVGGWVEPGSVFGFELRVTNLMAVELGALLWLLTLPEGVHLRLGAGRPLGFGSLRLRLTDASLARGADLRQRYRDLASPQPRGLEVAEELTTAFVRAAEEAYRGQFAELPFIAAFLAAARGHEGPVHYPRLARQPDEAGESFKWFVENDRKHGQKLSLPAATDRRGLPYQPKER